MRWRWIKRIVLGCSILVFCAAFIPYDSMIAPKWQIQVSDLNGSPCVHQRVTQMWGYESLELLKELPHGGYRARFTDQYGNVEFPERTIRASLAWRVVGNVLGVLGAFVHLSGGGPVAYIDATGMQNAEHGFGISYKSGQRPPNLIVVDECFDSSRELEPGKEHGF